MKRLVFTLMAIATSLGAPRNIHNRIFGGEPAAPGQFPFIVSLNRPGQFCAGSIINKNWILTAAHCADRLLLNSTALAGTTTEHAGGQKFNITQWTMHENFTYDNFRDDIGLIKIDGEFIFDDLIQPVEFADPEANSSCFAVGWGTTEDEDSPEELQFVGLTALSLDNCREYAPDDSLYLGIEQVCTMGPVGQGACYGDSGGPLVYDGKLAGIVSYGMAPCAKGSPDVFTRPSAYVDWINQQIQG